MAKKLNQLPKFNVWDDPEDSRLAIEVKGLGLVAIHRTSEGIIVDVTNGDEVVGSLGLMESDFAKE